MAPRPLPSAELLRQLLHYDAETGKLYWRERPVGMFKDGYFKAATNCAKWNTLYAGKEAGTPYGAKTQYIGVRIFRKTYLAHRVAWKVVHGVDPVCIDHANGDKSDNRLHNLRNCTHSQNNSNRQPARGGSSGYKGVLRHAGKWVARIQSGGRVTHLGRFSSEADAARAYDIAASQQHGEFAQLNFPKRGRQ